MDILGMGTSELIVILLLAAFILGPERLTRNAREVGKFVRDVKNYFNTLSDELKIEMDVLDDIKDIDDELKK